MANRHEKTPENEKPGARPGFWVDATSKCTRDGYPAGMQGSGRRAREVMPAAMRALVRTSAEATKKFMDRTLARMHFATQHVSKRRLDGYSEGVTLTFTRNRSPGSKARREL
jgi:hypothetical protein